MSARVRRWGRSLLAVFALAAACVGVLGSVASASVPPPDPVLGPPPPAVPLAAGPSIWQQVHWMLTGAAIVLVIVGAVVAGAVLSRRHRVRARRLRISEGGPVVNWTGEIDGQRP